MDSKDRQKMCGSCDGRISLEAEECPYCGSVQQSIEPQDFQAQQYRSIQESLTAPYHPSYVPHTQQKSEPIKGIMQEKKYQQASGVLGIPSIPTDSAQEQQIQEEKSSFWPILFLSLAANLLVIGLLQLFFSENGVLRLEWDSQHWYFYCLAALPLFFLGLKKARLLAE